MKYRIKKLTAESGKSWYIPQCKSAWYSQWQTSDVIMWMNGLGYETIEEAEKHINTWQLKERLQEQTRMNMKIKKVSTIQK